MCLRLAPRASRTSPTVTPSGQRASRSATTRLAARDRLGREPHPVALDHQAGADEMAERLAPDAGGDGIGGPPREPAQLGQPRVLGHAGVRLAPIPWERPAVAHDHAGQLGEQGPLVPVEGGDVQPQRAGAGDGLFQLLLGRRQHGGLDHPAAGDIRRPGLSRQAGQVVGGHPAPLGDHPVHRPGRPGPADGEDRLDVEDLASADGLRPSALAQHEPVAGDERQTDGQPEAGVARGAGFDDAGADQPHVDRVLAAARVQLEGAPARHGMVEAGQHPEGDIDRGGHVPLARVHQGVAALQVPVADAGQVDGHPGTRADGGAGLVVGLQAAYARPGPAPTGAAGTDHADLIVHREGSAGQRPGDHRPRSLGGKRPVDPQPGPAPVRRRRGHGRQVVERLGQLGDADPGGDVDVYQAGGGDAAVGQPTGDVGPDLGRPLRPGGRGVGDGHHRHTDAQQLEDAQVLLGLRLPALGGGHDEQGAVDRAHPGEHVADEADVAGDVDQGDLPS